MRTSLFLLLAALLAIGCGKPDADSGTTAKKDAMQPKIATEELVAGTEVGDLALEIEGLDLNGDAIKLSDYRGKIVLLDFWGDW